MTLDDPRSALVWLLVAALAWLLFLGCSLITLDWFHAIVLRLRDWRNNGSEYDLIARVREDLAPGTVIPMRKTQPVERPRKAVGR